MKLLAILIVAVCVAFSQQVRNPNRQRGINLGGQVSGQYDMDEPITFELLGWPLSVASNGQAQAEASLHLAHQADALKRGLNLGGKVSGKYDMDEPIKLEILGWPLSVVSNGQAQAEGSLHLAHQADALKRGLNLGGKVSGKYNLDEPIKLEILGWPLSVDSEGLAAAEASLHLGHYEDALKRGLNLGGKVSGKYNLDEPIKLEILGWPLSVDSEGLAEAEASLHLGHYEDALKRGLNLGGKVSGKYNLDEPIKVEILGWPLSVDSEGLVEAESSIHLGHYEDALKRGINLGGKVSGQYNLDEPLNVEILGWPLSVDSKGLAEAEASVHLGQYADDLNRNFYIGRTP